jgi:hypothetical protein
MKVILKQTIHLIIAVLLFYGCKNSEAKQKIKQEPKQEVKKKRKTKTFVKFTLNGEQFYYDFCNIAAEKNNPGFGLGSGNKNSKQQSNFVFNIKEPLAVNTTYKINNDNWVSFSKTVNKTIRIYNAGKFYKGSGELKIGEKVQVNKYIPFSAVKGTFNFTATNINDPNDIITVTDGEFIAFTNLRL